MTKQRLRIRFRKEGDLRLIGHRDLARAFERLFRRAGLKLAMSEGYHPHPRMTFPSALSVGIQGNREIVEVVLAEEVTAAEARERLTRHAPEGLVLTEMSVLEPQEPKAKVERVTYEIVVPPERQAGLKEALQRLLASDQLLVTRSDRQTPRDVRPAIEHLELDGDRLRMQLRVSQTINARPRDLLETLELADLEQSGFWLTRTDVQLAS